MVVLLAASSVFASDIKKVTGTYTYFAPETMSIEKAKRIALERAMADALANEFGTSIRHNNTIIVSEDNDNLDEKFYSYAATDVKGEWIETIGEPKYEIILKDNSIVITCTVKGKAREKVAKDSKMAIAILKNGKDERFESKDFNNDDQMYLRFKSSADGYVLIYLLDQNNAYRLLPYRKQENINFEVKENQEYIFFDKESVGKDIRRQVDEYILQTELPYEINDIFVIYSPYKIIPKEDFTLSKNIPNEMKAADFHRWLGNLRIENDDINVEQRTITIKKK